jgi:acyl-homoserine lactone acylase PvdQ
MKMLWTRRILFACALLAPGVTASAQGPISGAELARVETAAAKVTIVRDRWGVPHVYAPTDAGITLGIGYAQAEDNWWLLEEEYIRVTGRTAELAGDSTFMGDAGNRLGRAEQRAKAGLAAAPPAFRAMMQAYADGVNLWIARHPGSPRLITRFEAWYPFAFDGAGAFGGGVRLGRAALGRAPRGRDPAPGAGRDEAGEGEVVAGVAMPDEFGRVEAAEGSNAWAIGPSRTTTGHAMLFMNPHWNFLTSGLRWEVHVESGEGWRFSGFCILGNPIPRTGQNGRLGWTHTNLAGDFDDLYAVTFDHPTDTLMYRWEGGWRKAEAWSDTVMVRRGGTLVPEVVHLLRTHHGPVVAWTSPTRAIAVRTIAEEVAASPLLQRYRMGRSANLAEWREAMAMRTFAGSGTTYADADGNIVFAVGNAMPKRKAGAEWRGSPLLDGKVATTAWDGLLPIDDVPMLVNPATGFVQHTNSTPWLATADGANLDSTRFPPYVGLDRDNPRSVNSRRLLGGTRRFSFDDWQRTTMDTRVWWADSVLTPLLDELDRFAKAYPGRTLALREIADTLRAWDHVSDTTSVATTLFVQWDRDMRANRPVPWDSAWRRVASLERARDSLVAAWRTWKVPFGRVNRLQRVPPVGNVPFDSARRSWAVANIEGNFGIIRNMSSTPAALPGQRDPRLATTGRTRYGVAGNSYVAVAHFAPRVEHRSVLTLGESADSTSRLYTDQATFFASRTYKPAPFYAEEVQALAERAYHPGQKDAKTARVPAWAKRAPAVTTPANRVAGR